MRILLILLFLAGPAWGQMLHATRPPAAAGGACSSPTAGDLLNEGFEGTGYEDAGWSVVSETVYPDASRPGTDPGNLCDESLNWQGADTLEYIRINEGTARTTVYFRFWFYYSSYTASQTFDIVRVGSSNNEFNKACLIQFSSWSDHSMKGYGSTSSTSVNVDPDTWHQIDMTCVKGGTSYFSIDGGTEYSFTAADYDIQYYDVGGALGTDAGSYYADGFMAKSSAF